MQTCVGCGKNAPETDTNYTLISAQFGWRLTRFKGPAGTTVLEWRCPACWREYKSARAARAISSPTPSAVAGPAGKGRPQAPEPQAFPSNRARPGPDPSEPAPADEKPVAARSQRPSRTPR